MIEYSIYHIAGMFGRVNVWQTAELKVNGKNFGEWMNFGHLDTIYKLKFG